MGLRCIFGHDSLRRVWNAGLVAGECRRCGKPLIRGQDGHWYALPKGVGIRWSSTGSHGARPHQVMIRAQQDAPLLHRLRPLAAEAEPQAAAGFGTPGRRAWERFLRRLRGAGRSPQ